MQGEQADWMIGDHLLAYIADTVADANWQRTEDGHKGRRRPNRIPRPASDAPEPNSAERRLATPAEIDAALERVWGKRG